jgi:hypothetical protein
MRISPKMQNVNIEAGWISKLDEARRDRTIKLIMESVKDEGMLGFEEADEPKVKNYVVDWLREL